MFPIPCSIFYNMSLLRMRPFTVVRVIFCCLGFFGWIFGLGFFGGFFGFFCLFVFVLHVHPQSMLQEDKGNLRVAGVNWGGGGIFVLGTGAFVGTRTDVREMGKGRETVRIWTSLGVSWGG